jgi:uncharacterized protein
MSVEQLVLFCLAIGVIAFLYSSVGHAGASGYIAVMSIAEFEQSFIKPTSLALNVMVASIASWQFYRAGHFSWSLFWPFALFATPLAFLGGNLDIPTKAFKVLVGLVLILSAVRFLIPTSEDSANSVPSVWIALPSGGALGFLAGLTGTGGGIFLTPLLLSMRWATTKTAAAVSAVFILLNSAAGLLGNLSQTRSFPAIAIPIAVTAVSAGIAGSYFGSKRFQHETIKRLLSVVLVIAGSKLIFT